MGIFLATWEGVHFGGNIPRLVEWVSFRFFLAFNWVLVSYLYQTNPLSNNVNGVHLSNCTLHKLLYIFVVWYLPQKAYNTKRITRMGESLHVKLPIIYSQICHRSIYSAQSVRYVLELVQEGRTYFFFLASVFLSIWIWLHVAQKWILNIDGIKYVWKNLKLIF